MVFNALQKKGHRAREPAALLPDAANALQLTPSWRPFAASVEVDIRKLRTTLVEADFMNSNMNDA